MVKGIAFDMDGLMFDTERLAMQAWIAAGEQMGLLIPVSLILRTTGIDENGTKAILMEQLGPDMDYALFRRLRLEIMFRQIQEHGLPVKPGLVELLAYLKEHGYLMTMATSSKTLFARYNLDAAGLSGYFPEIVCGDMVARGKPDPEIYLKAAALMGVAPRECLALEDSPAGILAAFRAGMMPVMIPDLVEPDEKTRQLLFAKLASLHEVAPLLEKLCKDFPDCSVLGSREVKHDMGY